MTPDIGLSERLREAKRRWAPIMAAHPAYADASLLTALDEAAKQLDAFHIMVQELEDDVRRLNSDDGPL